MLRGKIHVVTHVIGVYLVTGKQQACQGLFHGGGGVGAFAPPPLGFLSAPS